MWLRDHVLNPGFLVGRRQVLSLYYVYADGSWQFVWITPDGEAQTAPVRSATEGKRLVNCGPGDWVDCGGKRCQIATVEAWHQYHDRTDEQIADYWRKVYRWRNAPAELRL
jgi:hypothetical protein